MSTEWAAERLDALPEGTVIEVIWPNREAERLIRELDHDDLVWAGTSGNYEDSRYLSSMGVPIRVVSVPIDALLTDETLGAAFEAAFLPNGFGAWSAKRAIRAAIAHVTGEQP